MRKKKKKRKKRFCLSDRAVPLSANAKKGKTLKTCQAPDPAANRSRQQKTKADMWRKQCSGGVGKPRPPQRQRGAACRRSHY